MKKAITGNLSFGIINSSIFFMKLSWYENNGSFTSTSVSILYAIFSLEQLLD
jgi:hypothetical protein